MTRWLAALLLASLPATGCGSAALTTVAVGGGITAAGGVATAVGCSTSTKCSATALTTTAIIAVGVLVMLVGGGIYTADKLTE